MKKPSMFVHFAIVAAALSLAACGTDRDRADRSGPGISQDNSADRAAGNLSYGDRNFVEETARDGMAEVEMARLAEQKASNPRVKEYARQLVEDHTKANEELKRIAAAQHFAAPAEIDGGARRKIDNLKELSGTKFDHEFLKHSIEDHEDNIKDFEEMTKDAENQDLKHFASTTLPRLHHHLEMARNLQGGQ
jgi:putative membrane protein